MSGRTDVSADIKHVCLRQQYPRIPTTRKMTAYATAHTAVRFQLLVDLVACYCQSAWQEGEWLEEEKPEGQALPPGCVGKIFLKYAEIKNLVSFFSSQYGKTEQWYDGKKKIEEKQNLHKESKSMKQKQYLTPLYPHVLGQFSRLDFTVIVVALVVEVMVINGEHGEA